jgi:RsiW-degrading membrane proteinase PrsW (M82 family)
MPFSITTLYDIIGGILPSLAWLWFWVREDADHHEPRYIIALAFLTGMVAVAVAIFLEQAVQPLIASMTLTYVVWSAMEEFIKYGLASITVLYKRVDSEPIDPVIYMIVVALGFSAVENILFLMSPLGGHTAFEIIMTGNLRFVGATVIHTLSSGVIGAMIGLSFYQPRYIKALYTVFGLAFAILLHSSFNLFILNVGSDSVFRVFGVVWVGVVALLALLEYIKRIHPRRKLARQN